MLYNSRYTSGAMEPMRQVATNQDQVGRFITTKATIGMPLDLTTQEIHLELLYLADVAVQTFFNPQVRTA